MGKLSRDVKIQQLVSMAHKCPYIWNDNGSMFTLKFIDGQKEWQVKEWLLKVVDLCVSITHDK